MKLILSTSNIIGAGPFVPRLPQTNKSNAELISSLRQNFEDHKSSSASEGLSNGGNGDPNGVDESDYRLWTKQAIDDELQIPALDFDNSALEEERDQYDITVKLFFLPGAGSASRASETRDAINLVLKELHMPSIDLLIISFPGIYFDETEDCPNKISTRGPVEAEPEPLDSQIEAWKVLEGLHGEGLVKKLGVSEFGSERLQAFLEKTQVRPSVNQINLRDCCSVPRDLMALAKKEGIELLVHNDCSNILPRGTVRELLGPVELGGAGVLVQNAQVGDKRKSLHGEGGTQNPPSRSGLQGEVQPLWVVKYTAVVKNRGVVEKKGYFAAAQLTP